VTYEELLKRTPKLTEQQAFDRVARHLKRQRARAFDKLQGTCVNETRDGKRCAVACLFPKSVPVEDFGNGTLRNALGDKNDLDVCGLVGELLGVHDAAFDGKFRARLYQVAKAHGLDTRLVEPPKGKRSRS
jgi:hypothetical protein